MDSKNISDTYTIYRINDAGLEFLAGELNARHKTFFKYPLKLKYNKDILCEWAEDAEDCLSRGEIPQIEIRSFAAISGHAEIIYLDTAKHFEMEVQS